MVISASSLVRPKELVPSRYSYGPHKMPVGPLLLAQESGNAKWIQKMDLDHIKLQSSPNHRMVYDTELLSVPCQTFCGFLCHELACGTTRAPWDCIILEDEVNKDLILDG